MLATLAQSAPPIRTQEQADEALLKLERAGEEFRRLDQAQTDAIFREVALEVNRQRVLLAALGAVETNMGLLEDKVRSRLPKTPLSALRNLASL